MRITLGQINTTPNLFNSNYKKIINGIDKAVSDNSDVIVFPELTIPGYYIRDLIFSNGFIEKNMEYLQKIIKYTENTKQLTVIVGYADKNYSGFGKPFKNMAAAIRNGKLITTYQKHLLPTYDVFEENLYYESGKDICVFEVAGKKCSILLCEDLWRIENNLYIDNPIESVKKANVDFIFSLNSSPFVKNKPEFRTKMLQKVSKYGNFVIAYINQIGGNDELVFDGNSQIVNTHGVITCVKNPLDVNDTHYDASYTTVSVDEKTESPYFIQDEHQVLKMILLGLKDYIKKNNFKSVVIGSSGGLDSALTATLCSLAIGSEQVNCLMLPSKFSSEGSVLDAKKLHSNLGCKEYLIPIDHDVMLKGFHNNIKNDGSWNKVADENIQARIRMCNIMMFSNGFGALMVSTMNKSEGSCGYGTIYADGCGGFNPIGDLFKTEIFELCKEINKIYGKELIPNEIINKRPSAELNFQQFDEDSLLPYPMLDLICKNYIEDYITDYETFKKVNVGNENAKKIDESNYNRIVKLINNAEFKRRQVAPIVKISKVAFGVGRRIPICKG
jgi:NAD+ synthase (glutamine-hydrolysing)